MEADYFAMLRLPPGRYDRGQIERQYRAVRGEILRAGGPNRQSRLDDALIARSVLRSTRRQVQLIERFGQAVQSAPSRPVGKPRLRAARLVRPVEPAPPANPDVYARFARMATDHVEAGLLRFSARQRLMLLAAGLGIGEFKANLIIAEVLHDIRAGQNSPGQQVSGPPVRPSRADKPRWGRLIALAACIAATIDLAAWLLWLGR